jgi:NAD(P)-dependent dehydrogenase (short-subunit alcohol dehydrogenase family)
VAIVSGIGPGLGIELARAFAREGADVAMGARTESALRDAAAEVEAQGGGAIVNVNSMIQKKVLPYQAGYAASKGALTAATRALARELGPYGIRVNQTYMGWMWGPPVEGYVNGQAEALGVPKQQVIAEITKDIPLGISPDDADCANAVVFLASDLAKVITGAGLDVNGGEYMS